MIRFTVRFDRQTVENHDLEMARINFPNESNELILLYDQFMVELRQSTLLRGKWRVFDKLKVSEEVFSLWTSFDWLGTVESFEAALQSCFDEDGMSGNWTLLDVLVYPGFQA